MFVHKNNLIRSATKPFENTLLETIRGKELATPQDNIITNYYGEQFVVSDDYIREMERVEIKPSKRKKMNSPFVEQYMKQMKMMSNLQQEEDSEYIEKFQDRVRSVNDALNETYND